MTQKILLVAIDRLIGALDDYYESGEYGLKRQSIM